MHGSRASQHSFAQIPDVHLQRSKFDRSYTVKDTIDFDFTYPCFVEEIIPGDTINLDVHAFGRLATQIKPIMDGMTLDFHFFFVPNRIVWDNWEKFMGQQNAPGDSTDYLIPVLSDLNGSTLGNGNVFDKFGIPTNTGGTISGINALPFRAYNLIYNEWFRDQNLQNPRTVPLDDGPDDGIYYLQPFKRNKKHDYFTSAFTAPQKGPAVTIPLSASGAIVSNTQQVYLYDGTNQQPLTMLASPNANITSSGALTAGAKNLQFGSQTGLRVSDSAMGTIEQLRQAIMMQSLLELNMRGGTRYVELLRAHFKVVSPDFRLQRPEYLGGGVTSINVHPVPQSNASDGADTPQANLASFGTVSTQGQRIGFTKSFVEHGYVIGLYTARGAVTYQQGLNKLWSRRSKYDFFWPKLQELGEQAVLKKELLYTGVPSQDNAVFGYQERYAEYRYHPSEIRGQFRSTDPLSLDVWHLAEELAYPSNLTSNFIQSATPIDRAIAVTDQPDLLMDLYYRLTHTRPMVTYAVPASIGRF